MDGVIDAGVMDDSALSIATVCAMSTGLIRMLRPTPIDLLWHEEYSLTVVNLLKTIKNVCMEARGLCRCAGACHWRGRCA